MIVNPTTSLPLGGPFTTANNRLLTTPTVLQTTVLCTVTLYCAQLHCTVYSNTVLQYTVQCIAI